MNSTENPKRSLIIKSAEKIIALKGSEDTSISEIAQQAGVNESVIYQFFEGKEDLLFSIPGERMKEVIFNLNHHLEGIEDPLSRLRKMIWFHLYYNDTFQDYARILLLECRSNRNFYKHYSYTLIRKYAGILLSILEDGVTKNIFDSKINMRVVRDIIFGLLDWENLECLAAKEIENSVSDLEDIMYLITPMISPSIKDSEKDANKSNRILFAAEKVFADKGYHQATIAEIAKNADVAEGTIYEYFKSKRELLFSIPDFRFKDHINKLGEIFEIKNPIRKLRRFIRYHFMLYLTQSNFSKIFLLHIQLNRKFYDSHVYLTFKNYLRTIEDVIEEGKKSGLMRSDINPRIFKNLFLGAFSHMALRWLILDKENKIDKMEEIEEAVYLLTKAVVK